MISKVKIGLYTYDVEETNEHLIIGNQLCSGLIDYENLVILIKDEIVPQRKEQILAHEIIHGIVKDLNIPIDDLEEYEEIVDKFSIGMLQVLKDNPDLFRK